MQMRKILVTVLAATLTLLAVPAPAQASGCVTKTEYWAIHNGQTIRQVIRNTGADFVAHRASPPQPDGYRRDTFVFPTCPYAARFWGRYISVFTKDTPTRIFVVTGKHT